MQIVLNKKAQLKIQQMAFMLIAVSIFFILVALFYVVMKVASLEATYQEMQREKAENLVTKIAGFPELSFRGMSRAIDRDKLIILQERKHYDGFWGKGINGIIVLKIHPKSELVECVPRNYEDCSIIKLFTDKSVADISSYVSLCRNTMGSYGSDYECDIALIMLDVGEEFYDE